MIAELAALALQAAEPCAGGTYDDFDFWVGDWVVSDPAGKVQGRNVISKEESGCLVVERWTNASGGTGQSYNFYDLAAGAWRQVWIDASSVIDYAGSLDEAGVMRLEGTITYRKTDASAPFRGAWTLQANGSVRQHFTQYDADKDEWVDWSAGRRGRFLNGPSPPPPSASPTPPPQAGEERGSRRRSSVGSTTAPLPFTGEEREGRRASSSVETEDLWGGRRRRSSRS